MLMNKAKYNIIVCLIGFGLLMWVIDAMLDYLIFDKGGFWELLIPGMSSHDFITRLMVVINFIIFGAIAARFVSKLNEVKHENANASKQLSISNRYFKNSTELLTNGDCNLQERVKELNCLYGLSQLVEKNDVALDQILQGSVDLIPSGWQYSEITCARLFFANNEYKTTNFCQTAWAQSANINIHGKKAGQLEVYYLEEKAELDEGPFLKEERRLLEALVERLGHIIERIYAEETLRKSEEKYQAISEDIPIMICRFLPNGEITYVNKAYCEYFQTTARYLEGKMFLTLIPQANREAVMVNISSLTVESPTQTHEHSVILSDEKVHWQRWINRALFDERGEIIAYQSIGEDITERKLAEEKLEAYHTQLQTLSAKLSLTEAQERRDIASELHDHIGQDLALSVLKLSALKQQASSAEMISVLDEIGVLVDNAIQDTQTLTFDLSFLSLLQRFGFERSVAQWMQQRVEEQHGIKATFIDDGQGKPMADDVCVLLFQAVRELLVNVIKHSQARSVTVTVKRNGTQIETVVQDDGVGCDVTRIATVFPERRGSGFGLFNIKERFDYLGGQFKIESEIGNGTRITLTTPLKHEEVTESDYVHQGNFGG